MKTLTIFLCLLGVGIFGFGFVEAKRDPFEPFIELDFSRGGEKPLPPLQRYQISQLKLTGIIGSEADGYRALMQDKTGEGFVIMEGSLVGSKGSTVKEIRRDRVITIEEYRDYLGKEKARQVVWRLSNAVNQRSISKAEGRKGSR
ncbi:MAG: hypothetical protein ACE5I8_00590 [Thermodesulfobacteriota bacterium]